MFPPIANPKKKDKGIVIDKIAEISEELDSIMGDTKTGMIKVTIKANPNSNIFWYYLHNFLNLFQLPSKIISFKTLYYKVFGY